jgi:hypothetical protein
VLILPLQLKYLKISQFFTGGYCAASDGTICTLKVDYHNYKPFPVVLAPDTLQSYLCGERLQQVL